MPVAGSGLGVGVVRVGGFVDTGLIGVGFEVGVDAAEPVFCALPEIAWTATSGTGGAGVIGEGATFGAGASCWLPTVCTAFGSALVPLLDAITIAAPPAATSTRIAPTIFHEPLRPC